MKPFARGAGVLLHITSLPSRFGCGDFGPEATRFCNFLKKSGQKYWQILPLGPTDVTKGFSPYSASSSLAINTRLISPEILAKKKLLPASALRNHIIKNSNTVDFERSSEINKELLGMAYKRFKSSADTNMKRDFLKFCKSENEWLDDFAIYTILKEQYTDAPWYDWPAAIRNRRKASIEEIKRRFHDEILEQKWYQFIGFSQWHDLRAHCHKSGISIIGDLPIYVSHDSVDVWVHPELFSITTAGTLTSVAGVPPDYFNANGQRWGMPVFRWNVVARKKFTWWNLRIRKNMELFDIIRLDHFRAFSAYWNIPARDQTAKNGSWKKGPGADLFRNFRNEIGALPFIAEDLGDIDEPVLDLRDEFGFPGMKVLQFAFGNNSMNSEYAPHNFQTSNAVVYTGTHDNNTTRGWYKHELKPADRERIGSYLQYPVSEKNIHWELIRLAYSSIASIAIIPMQDVLGLDMSSRMNVPATTEGNWRWRLRTMTSAAKNAKLLALVKLFNR